MLIAYVFCIYISERHFSLIISMVIGSAIFGAGALLNVWGGTYYILRQHRIMGQGDSARNFDPSESMENAGILCVFPIFILHDWGKRSVEACSSHCAVLP